MESEIIHRLFIISEYSKPAIQTLQDIYYNSIKAILGIKIYQNNLKLIKSTFFKLMDYLKVMQ